MQISYEEIFKYSDVFNPLSPTTLLSAGKIAQLEPEITILDLGSGKGFPSLLWASVFGVHVEGFDLSESYVAYANSRAKLLNLSDKVQYFCQDLKGYTFNRKYDVVASLGLDITIYGGRSDALSYFKNLLKKDGVLIMAEPFWLKKPVHPEIQKTLGVGEASFITLPEMQQLLQRLGFRELGHFVSSKEDWELYVRPVYVALHEIIKEKPALAEAARGIIDAFRAESDAAGQYWDMALWVLKTS